MQHASTYRELWRISDFRDLSGEGGLRHGARWHTAGHPIVYLAESAPGALLEVLVHLEVEDNDLPRPYNLLRVTVPTDIVVERPRIPENDTWKHDIPVTRAIGDEWLTSGRSALAEVPSAIMLGTRNYLLNPSHTDAGRIQIAEVLSAEFDPRLLRKVRT
jgi:RES domain-containing protein